MDAGEAAPGRTDKRNRRGPPCRDWRVRTGLSGLAHAEKRERSAGVAVADDAHAFAVLAMIARSGLPGLGLDIGRNIEQPGSEDEARAHQREQHGTFGKPDR